jgi:hypothetical protein
MVPLREELQVFVVQQTRLFIREGKQVSLTRHRDVHPEGYFC